MSEVTECVVRLVEGVSMHGRANANLRSDSEEFGAVVSCVRGDAAQRSLLEEVVFIIQRGNVSEIDTRYRQNPATIERAKGCGHYLAHRSEEDGAIQ